MNTFGALIGGVGKHVHNGAGMRSRAVASEGATWATRPQASHLLLWLVCQLVKTSRSHAQVTH